MTLLNRSKKMIPAKFLLAFSMIYVICGHAGHFHGVSRDHSVYGPGQWEMALQCNAIFHWLGAYTEWSVVCPGSVVIAGWPVNGWAMSCGRSSMEVPFHYHTIVCPMVPVRRTGINTLHVILASSYCIGHYWYQYNPCCIAWLLLWWWQPDTFRASHVPLSNDAGQVKLSIRQVDFGKFFF